MSLEDALEFQLDFSKGLIPVTIVEDGQVLYGASQNQEAFEMTLRTGKMTLWSKSRQRLWVKGESSGDYLRVVEPPRINCEQNQLLYIVERQGPAACHTGEVSCFYRRLVVEDGEVRGLERI